MATQSTPLAARRSRVLGLPVDVCPDVFAAALDLHGAGGGQIVTLNAEMTMAALEQPELGAVIHAAELVIPDGAGVVWALRRQGHRVRRTPGIELADRLLQQAAEAGWRVALVGASPEVMAALSEHLRRRLPALQLVLTIHGYQAPEAWPGLEHALHSAQLDLVLVALGCPARKPGFNESTTATPGCGWGWAAASMSGPASKKGAPLDGHPAIGMAVPPHPGTRSLAADAGLAGLRLGGDPGAPLKRTGPELPLAAKDSQQKLISGSPPRPARRRPAAGRTGE